MLSDHQIKEFEAMFQDPEINFNASALCYKVFSAFGLPYSDCYSAICNISTAEFLVSKLGFETTKSIYQIVTEYGMNVQNDRCEHMAVSTECDKAGYEGAITKLAQEYAVTPHDEDVELVGVSDAAE